MARKARARSKVTPLHYVTFYGTGIHDTELDVADLCCVDTIHTNGQVQSSNPRISGGRFYPSIPTPSQPNTEALATNPTWHPGPFKNIYLLSTPSGPSSAYVLTQWHTRPGDSP